MPRCRQQEWGPQLRPENQITPPQPRSPLRQQQTIQARRRPLPLHSAPGRGPLQKASVWRQTCLPACRNSRSA